MAAVRKIPTQPIRDARAQAGQLGGGRKGVSPHTPPHSFRNRFVKQLPDMKIIIILFELAMRDTTADYTGLATHTVREIIREIISLMDRIKGGPEEGTGRAACGASLAGAIGDVRGPRLGIGPGLWPRCDDSRVDGAIGGDVGERGVAQGSARGLCGVRRGPGLDQDLAQPPLQPVPGEGRGGVAGGPGGRAGGRSVVGSTFLSRPPWRTSLDSAWPT